ncbi:hypothetical protein Tco_1178728 [Tanacetum coccineum]
MIFMMLRLVFLPWQGVTEHLSHHLFDRRNVSLHGDLSVLNICDSCLETWEVNLLQTVGNLSEPGRVLVVAFNKKIWTLERKDTGIGQVKRQSYATKS